MASEVVAEVEQPASAPPRQAIESLGRIFAMLLLPLSIAPVLLLGPSVLRAPIAGTVQQLAVSSLGQVVSSGQSLLTVVPLGGSIEVEVMIANEDIGFVEVGQPAVIKVDAFPFTRYGTVNGVATPASFNRARAFATSRFGGATSWTYRGLIADVACAFG